MSPLSHEAYRMAKADMSRPEVDPGVMGATDNGGAVNWGDNKVPVVFEDDLLLGVPAVPQEGTGLWL